MLWYKVLPLMITDYNLSTGDSIHIFTGIYQKNLSILNNRAVIN